VATNLDWSDPRHWRGGRAQRCIYCAGWTPLVDKADRPAHKTCAEHRVDEILAQRKEQTS